MILSKRREEAILSKPISADAEAFANECIDEFAETLLWQARALAYQRRNEMVLQEHVEDSLRIAQRIPGEKWLPQLLILAGGALAGTSIQGTVSELLKTQVEMSVTALAVYIILGGIGMTTTFLGFWKQHNS